MMISFTSMTVLGKDKSAPDMALLEFIGEGVKAGNEVVDPVSWQAMQDMTGKRQAQAKQDRQQSQQSARHKQNEQQKHD